MSENQPLRDRLQQLLSRKRSRKYYAQKLGVSEEEIRKEMYTMKDRTENLELALSYVCDLEDTIVKLEEDVKKGQGELTIKTREEIKTLEELIVKGKIDTEKWNIDRYIQNYWGNGNDPHWQVKAYLSVKTPQENFHKNFTEFLKTYNPSFGCLEEAPDWDYISPKSCVIINKQDEHLNKLDINGNNDIQKRFDVTYKKVNSILDNASNVNYLEKIIYVIGSDEFNSEWTSCTTRGTPQNNLTSYQNSFEKICNYELQMISLLKSYSDYVHVIYVPGNHDEYVGWHLIHWLQAAYKNSGSVSFDISPKYTKYMRYGKSAIMFNHGDAIKPAKLANMFPVQFKEEWGKCDNFYVFTGDKHHEISIDFNGIKFYQLPALSNAKSSWDEKNGHICSPAELTAFLIEEEQGMTAIYKQKL